MPSSGEFPSPAKIPSSLGAGDPWKSLLALSAGPLCFVTCPRLWLRAGSPKPGTPRSCSSKSLGIFRGIFAEDRAARVGFWIPTKSLGGTKGRDGNGFVQGGKKENQNNENELFSAIGRHKISFQTWLSSLLLSPIISFLLSDNPCAECEETTLHSVRGSSEAVQVITNCTVNYNTG